MTRSPVVSVVTPCYNGEATIGRLLDSVLAQTYTNIELIVVNDGSADGTEDAIREYEPTLRHELAGFTYVQQDNTGLGGAIQAGLRRVTGDFLCWPDADDWLEPMSVADRLAAIEAHPDCAVVTSDAWIRSADDPKKQIGRASLNAHRNDDPHQFEHLLRAESIFAPGTHLACMRRFDETHPGREIFPARRGQNWQMLLPLYHRYPRFYLDVPLYNYVISTGSMSQSDRSVADRVARFDEHDAIVRHTLEAMEMSADERVRADAIAAERYGRALMTAGRQFHDLVVMDRGYATLRGTGQATVRDHARWLQHRIAHVTARRKNN